MLGSFRFLLAILVATSHLVATDETAHLGNFAVRAFFVISGMGISASLNEVYHFDMRSFWRNRILRLLPNYLLACVITALVIRAWPDDAGIFLPRWQISPDWVDILQNTLVVPLAFAKPDFRFIEPAWSIAVEMFMYALLCFGMARNERSAILGLSVGVLYHGIALYFDEPFAVRYFGIEAALFGFGLGALTFFLVKRGALQPSARLLAVTAAIWLANLVFAGSDVLPPAYAEGSGYYLNTLFAAPLAACLSNVKLAPSFRKIDRWLGDIAYPFFLSQWVGGFLAHQWIVRDEWRGIAILLFAVPITLGLSMVLVAIQKGLVEPTRNRIRSSVPATERDFPIRAYNSKFEPSGPQM